VTPVVRLCRLLPVVAGCDEALLANSEAPAIKARFGGSVRRVIVIPGLLAVRVRASRREERREVGHRIPVRGVARSRVVMPGRRPDQVAAREISVNGLAPSRVVLRVSLDDMLAQPAHDVVEVARALLGGERGDPGALWRSDGQLEGIGGQRVLLDPRPRRSRGHVAAALISNSGNADHSSGQNRYLYHYLDRDRCRSSGKTDRADRLPARFRRLTARAEGGKIEG